MVLPLTIKSYAVSTDSSHSEMVRLENKILEWLENSPNMAYEQAINLKQIAEKNNDSLFLAKSYLYMGKYFYYNGIFHKALEQQTKAYEIFFKIVDMQNSVLALNDIAKTYYAQDFYDMADEYCFMAKDIAQSYDFPVQLADSYKTMGIIKLKLDEKSALKSLLVAKNIIDSLEIKELEIENNIYLGLAYSYNGNQTLAEDLLKNNIENINTDEKPYLAAKNYCALAETSCSAGNPLKGVSYYNKALEVCINYDLRKLAAEVLCKIANLQLAADNVDASLSNAVKALEISRLLKVNSGVDELEIKHDACKTIYMVYDKLKDTEKKLFYANRLSQIADSMLIKNKDEQFEIYQINTEAQKKKREIELLTANRRIAQLEQTQNIVIKSMIFAIIVAIVSVIFAIIFFKRNKKYNTDIQKLNSINKKNLKELQDRRITESELRANEEKYHNIFKEIPMAVIQFDDLHNIITVNDKAVQIFGNITTNLVGKKIETIIPSHIFKGFETTGEKYHANRHEFEINSNSGKKSFMAIFKPYNYSVSQEMVKGGIMVVEDITEAKNVERENFSQSQGGLLGLLPGAFLLLDQQNICKYVQIPGQPDALQRYSGVNITEVLVGADADKLKNIISSVKETGSSKILEYMLDDNYYEAHVIPAGHGVLVAVKDITTYKKSEAELIAAKNTAENDSKAKTEFLMSITGEIKRPLEKIKEKLDSNAPIDEQEMTKSVSEILTTVTDFMKLTKVEAEKRHQTVTYANPVKIVQEIYKIFEPRAEQKNLYYKLEIDPSIPENIEIDTVRLRQVLFNIISNAIKFTNKGGVDIKIAKNIVGQNHTNLIFTIADTGIGMTKDELEKVFQDTTPTDGKLNQNAGKNLINSKRLVDAMNGTMFVNTRLNEGTLFTITFSNVKIAENAPKNSESIDNKEKIVQQANIKPSKELRLYAEELNTEIIPQYRMLKKKASFKSFYELANKFIEISKRHKVESAIKTGTQFIVYLKNYDITNINITLRELEQYITNILQDTTD